MGVVARLIVLNVEHWANTKVVNMQAASVNDDPHNEEIKQFMHSTPVASVKLSVPFDYDPEMKAGVNTYLYFEDEPSDETFEHLFKVRAIRIDSYATQIEFAVERNSDNGYNSSEMSFTIRNETASEHFQLGTVIYARFVKIPLVVPHHHPRDAS